MLPPRTCGKDVIKSEIMKSVSPALAGKAKAGCPVSKLLNAKITLDASLVV
jgi:organic hydroperoxide reductase OsmC/OhrA